MKRLLAMLLTTIALLAACATYPDTNRQRLETLPQRYSQFDLVMAWETRVADGHTVVDGVVRNVRYHVMYDLEIWVALLDPAGKVAERSVSFIIPTQLGMDQTAPFTVKLPVAVAPGDKLRFTYKYRPSEGGDDGFAGGLGRSTDWMQSFESVVPAMTR